MLVAIISTPSRIQGVICHSVIFSNSQLSNSQVGKTFSSHDNKFTFLHHRVLRLSSWVRQQCVPDFCKRSEELKRVLLENIIQLHTFICCYCILGRLGWIRLADIQTVQIHLTTVILYLPNVRQLATVLHQMYQIAVPSSIEYNC